MRKRYFPVMILLAVAGCTDTADSIMLEYRNTDNEAIDAMMMVTSEDRARRMNLRVFKPLGDRYKLIDKKLEIMLVNRTSKQLVEETYTSIGIVLYIHESTVNQRRYRLEARRISNLLRQYIDGKKAELRANGEDDTKVTVSELWPGLFQLAGPTGKPPVDALASQLKIVDLKDDDESKLEEKFDEMLKDIKDTLLKGTTAKEDEKFRKDTLKKVSEVVPPKLAEVLDRAHDKLKSGEEKKLQDDFLKKIVAMAPPKFKWRIPGKS